MREYLFLFLVAIAVVAFAVQHIYVGLTNLHPTRMTCKQFLDTSPSAKWIEPTECEVDYLEAIHLQSAILKVDKGTYVPVRTPGDAGPARILVKMNSEDVNARIKAWITAPPSTAATESSVAMPAPNHTETVTGLISFGMEEDSKARCALDKEVTAGALHQDFLVIDDHAKPDPADLAFGFAIILAAVILIVVFAQTLYQAVASPAAVDHRSGLTRCSHLRPLGQVLGQRRYGIACVVNSEIIPGSLVGGINHRLQVQRRIRIAKTDWDTNCFQPFFEPHWPNPSIVMVADPMP